ncbi:MAG: hypothetical protein PVH19_14575 [Planctomycetia bacterium]|jgi:hypothetical protein
MSSTSESLKNDHDTQTGRGMSGSGFRIDAPHFVGMSPEFSLGPVPVHTAGATAELAPDSPPAIPLVHSRERLQRQANELGARLETRCRDLDQREAQLNTRSAEFERELRAARLWISEKQIELREREEQIDAQAKAFSQAAVSQTTPPAEPRCNRQDDEELQRRCEELKKIESSLRDARSQLEECRSQLVQKRAEFDHEMAGQRKLLEHYRADVEAQLDAKRKELDRQARTNEQIRVVLERCREEIEQKHRESLQLRLATEELWVQMADGLPTTAMLQSLSKIRSRLAEEYRAAEARMVRRPHSMASNVGG